MKHVAIGLLLIVVGGFLATTSVDVMSQEEEPEVTELRILLGEMFIQVAGQAPNTPITLKAGQPYKLIIMNVGARLHHVQFGQTVVLNPENGRESGYETNLLTGVDSVVNGTMNDDVFQVESRDLVKVQVRPRQELELSFTLPESAIGEWEVGCFVGSHYAAGMHAPVIVE